MAIEGVDIQPDVGVLSVLPHLNYKPWFALSEFVDNALESYLRCRSEIELVEGADFKLKVEVVLDTSDGGRITVRDNAAGIYENEYQRAFRLAEPPPHKGGLSEFGMGMKSAACWFGSRFTVRSSALGEPVERTVEFDIDNIVETKAPNLLVVERTVPAEAHFTEIAISKLHNTPQPSTVKKIKKHLASIYRVFIRKRVLDIRFQARSVDEILEYEEPAILNAPPDESLVRKYEMEAEPLLWWKQIDFDFGKGLRVTGFAALRQKASTSLAGFALFRRDRLIEGSGEDSYRPQEIFGASTTAPYQRIFGELHLEGFEVSHTKDGFRWDENEDSFLDLLKEHLNAEPLPLIDQAKKALYGFNKSHRLPSLSKVVQEVVEETGEILREAALPIIEEQIQEEPKFEPPPLELPSVTESWAEVLDLELSLRKWQVTVKVTLDPAVGDWIEIFDSGNAADEIRQLGVSLSLSHPFMARFVESDLERIKPFVRLAAAIGLAELTAREAGGQLTGQMRRNINQLLRGALSIP